MGSYAYLTCHNLYQCGKPFNRPGWHIDGFGTDDVNYIWSNKQPTVFNHGPFSLSDDDKQSMIDMNNQAKEENNFTFPDCSLVRINSSVHKVGDLVEGMRCFLKFLSVLTNMILKETQLIIKLTTTGR